MTKEETFKLLALIESMYPNVTVKNETVLHWMAYCGFLDHSLVINNLLRHARSKPYPPSFDEITGLQESNAAVSGLFWQNEYSIRANHR
ncbi:hypothetical protein [Mesobacillus subterraneus]|uniref:Replicative helicase inhibitor G39P N-terminal domain-containing protein n=1 Tax=Mesobacillus subterraneus TaxID=285983 RepID=A0A3R9E6Y4_9BACI|nr:hypothetical protein [Mesobacillus subterraneus]RSD25398.1 hypothetical protein EJA10_16445 [Mesobacillus subterraneus]